MLMLYNKLDFVIITCCAICRGFRSTAGFLFAAKAMGYDGSRERYPSEQRQAERRSWP